MPSAPKKPCRWPGCPALTEGRFCPAHTKRDRRAVDNRRGSAASRGYDHHWQKYRPEYLRRHPLCRTCAAAGRVTVATVVDHIIPHRGDMELFWDPTNHQPQCKKCHDIKTATEDGGFGNGRP